MVRVTVINVCNDLQKYSLYVGTRVLIEDEMRYIFLSRPLIETIVVNKATKYKRHFLVNVLFITYSLSVYFALYHRHCKC